MPELLAPAELISSLERARPALEKVSSEELMDAFRGAVDALLVPGSEPLHPDPHHPDPHPPDPHPPDPFRDALARHCRLSRPGLDAALEVVLRGVRTPAALGLFEAASTMKAARAPALVVLASNLPGLAAQSLLPALALRRPLLVKSASAEPLFAPAFLEALSSRVEVIGRAYAASRWPGGSLEIETPLLERVERVVAYGGGAAIADLERRAGSKLIAFGPMLSSGLVGADADLDAVAAGLARDVALFDQRGCLSVQTVIHHAPTPAETETLAEALATALATLAERWPMGEDPDRASAARQARDEAIMRGAVVADLPITAGTVLLEPGGPLRPSPGRRLVRIYRAPTPERVLELLAPWRGQLQGLAIAGLPVDREPWRESLGALGFSRIAAAGTLQDADLGTWHNGGLAPLAPYL